ncbi:hypothetical protein ACTOB_003922 [Actinoplanes oblitus]|uniref:Nephrocystin 3-like N-terminal domain-containing protein n=1 Tax=Actinoplanes oblitus TaxID=3040509 RepID=A0ABY8WTT2_9ACTN|nr:hypothetical protein [Actinoplanes oblitus]WIN00228.1 hypothetical protein ACTOB_003922 [Actinoplanes oblitus]
MFFDRLRRVWAAALGDGSVVVGGDNSAPITTNVFHLSASPVAPPARSVYLEQVRRIAPPLLLDRDTELAELAAFCRGSGPLPYAWWRADAWAGKSALLSTFVLRPPADLTAAGIRIVSFFVTGRMAGTDTREAFTASLLHQLCALTGQNLPPVTDESTREAWMLAMLREAAEIQRSRGGRLILIVDGLDEERGVSLGPAISSIAGLLPADPPHDMRVIVASRPNPPLPGDVPEAHPLKDPRVVRRLTTSPHARDTEERSKAELRRLLHGADIERQLLGLLTASRGGLSQTDLRQLTGADLVTIEDALHTVGGRTFTHRADVWSAEAGKIYLLGHEDLHRTAVRYLGEEELAAYRRRLHAWADALSSGPWPSDAPEYLLRDYPLMLAEAGDIARLVALATNTARQDSMLDLIGGDHAVLAEIRTAQELVVSRPEPDLVALARLCRHRDGLMARNAAIPATLPALWAALDNPIRAESLARSLPGRARQVQALAGIAKARIAVGDTRDAAEWAAGAAELALNETDPASRARSCSHVAGVMGALGDRAARDDWADATRRAAADIPQNIDGAEVADVARALAIAGAQEQAESIAATVRGHELRERTLDRIARTRAAATGTVFARSSEADPDSSAVTAGDADQAEQVALAIRHPGQRAHALAELGLVAALAGDHDRGRALAVQAEADAREASSRHRDPRQVIDIARAVATAGDPDRAERIVRTIDRTDQRVDGLCAIAVAAAGHPGRAHDIARSIPETYRQATALAAVSEAVAASGDRTSAARLARLAERIARDIPAASQQAQALTAAARAAAGAGDAQRAEEIVLGIPDPADRVTALVELAAASEPDRSLSLAVMAQDTARTITSMRRRTRAVISVAEAMARAGDPARGRALAGEAATMVRTHPQVARTTSIWAEIAHAFVAAGDHEHALTLVSTREARGERDTVLTDIARSLAETGHLDRAERTLDAMRELPRWLGWETTDIARAMAAAGDLDRAERVARRSAPEFGELDRALRAVAIAGATHDPARAEAIAATIGSPDERARALTGIAETMGLPAGSHLLARAFVTGTWSIPLPALATSRPDLVLLITEDY